MINLFVSNAIFDNYQANAFCDEICNLLSKDGSFPSNLALSGKASKSLQEENYSAVIYNIVFRVDDWSAYLNLSEKLGGYVIRNYQKYHERLMFTYLSGRINVCFEIWFSSTPLNRLLKKNIYLENISNIPLNLL